MMSPFPNSNLFQNSLPVFSSSSSSSGNASTSVATHTNPKSVTATAKSSISKKRETPPEKRRVRTGCLTCRSKHKKCDEVKPVCKFCSSKGLKCVWPEKVRSDYSKINSEVQLISPLSLASHSGPLAPESSIPNFSLDPNNIQQFNNNNPLGHQLSFQNQSQNQNQNQNQTQATMARIPPSIPPAQISGGNSIENLLAFNYLFPNNQSASDLFNSANNSLTVPRSKSTPVNNNNIALDLINAPPVDITPQTYPLSETLSDLVGILCTKQTPLSHSPITFYHLIQSISVNDSTLLTPHLSKQEELLLLDSYFSSVIPFITTTSYNSSDSFERYIPVLATSSSALRHSMYAVTSRYLEKTNSFKSFSSNQSIQFYNFAVLQLLNELESGTIDESATFASCLFLLYFEVFSSKPESWRTRLSNFGLLLKLSCACVPSTKTVPNDKIHVLKQSIFWSFIKLDQLASGTSKKPCLIPIEFWATNSTLVPSTSSNQKIQNGGNTLTGLTNPNKVSFLGWLQDIEKFTCEFQAIQFIYGKVLDFMFNGKSRSTISSIVNTPTLSTASMTTEITGTLRQNHGGSTTPTTSATATPVSTQHLDFDTEWSLIWELLMSWDNKRSSPYKSCYAMSFENNLTTPVLIYSNSKSIASKLLFHTCCIMLLSRKPNSINFMHNLNQSTARAPLKSIRWHLDQVLGLVLGNLSQSNSKNGGSDLFAFLSLLTVIKNLNVNFANCAVPPSGGNANTGASHVGDIQKLIWKELVEKLNNWSCLDFKWMLETHMVL